MPFAKSIKSKLILYVIILIFILGISVFIPIQLHIKSILINGMKVNAEFMSIPILESLSSKLKVIPKVEDQDNFLETYIKLKGNLSFPQLIKQEQELEEIYFYNNKGICISGSMPVIQIPQDSLLSLINSTETNHMETPLSILISTPLIYKNSTKGAMIFIFSKNRLEKEINKFFNYLILVALFFTLFTILGILIISNSISKPIVSLTKKALELTDEKQLVLNKGSEIEILEDTFNAMKESITQTIKDLTQEIIQRKKTENELLESRNNLNITLESIGDGVITTDIQGIIVTMNSSAETITGWMVSEAIGKPLNVVYCAINKDTQFDISKRVHEVISGEKIIRDYELNLITKNNNVKIIEDSCSPIFNFEKQITGTVTVFKDKSEQALLENQLFHSQKMEAIGKLSGGIAHDFNNMLTGIRGGVDLLKLTLEPDEETMEIIDMISNSSQRAEDLIIKLLSFSRKQIKEYKTFDLNRSLDNVINILKRTINPQIEISSTLKAEKTFIKADQSEIENCLLNIGINASQAISQKGYIIFSSKNILLNDENNENPTNSCEYIEISIKDNGVGIVQENLKKIFDPFFSTKKEKSGSGLGLSIVYSAITAMKGQISVYSIPGNGTEFKIWLPVCKEVIEKKENPQKYTKGSGNVLVIDDEESIRKVMKLLLQNMGYRVETASNGKQGIELYKKSTFEVVVLDMLMPVMNGKECFFKLRKINPNAKILLVSAFVPPEDLEELHQSGLSGFLKKPLKTIELNKAMNSILAENPN